MEKKGNNRVIVKRKARIHKHLFSLNESENRALQRYIEKYRVSNKSRFIRETLMAAILKRFEEDMPTLFD